MKDPRPWPTKSVMDQIYKEKLWGGGGEDFYSGNGSHESNLINPYLDAVIKFLESFETKLSVCDLGCGDFNIGSQLVKYCSSYVGIDIVPSLISRNKRIFPEVSFKCLDISQEKLPKVDCAIIRQVLQHLSNTEIEIILKQLTVYKYIILTEHVPIGAYNPNKNKVSSMGIRLKNESGVDITKPPFNFEFKNKRELVCIEDKKWKGEIITTLFETY